MWTADTEATCCCPRILARVCVCVCKSGMVAGFRGRGGGGGQGAGGRNGVGGGAVVIGLSLNYFRLTLSQVFFQRYVNRPDVLARAPNSRLSTGVWRRSHLMVDGAPRYSDFTGVGWLTDDGIGTRLGEDTSSESELIRCDGLKTIVQVEINCNAYFMRDRNNKNTFLKTINGF